jgi:Nucleotidyl transferase AbiEii toxin, Type IV TA system
LRPFTAVTRVQIPSGTKDLDLLGRGSSAIDEVEQTIRAICEIQEEDGLAFDSASIEGTKIRENDEYDVVRTRLLADLAGARIPMQIDIGFELGIRNVSQDFGLVSFD